MTEKTRPPVSTITIEDCASQTTTVNGVAYHPHAGESITLTVPHSVAGRRHLAELAHRITTGGAAAFGDPATFDGLIDVAVRHVVAWTWTGRDGEPLPLPSADRAVVAEAVDWPELLWVFNALLSRGDPAKKEEEEGNGSAPSQNT